MTHTALRNRLVSSLYEFLGGPKVVLSDQVMPEADYPYIYYQSVQQHIPGPYNIEEKEVEGCLVRRRLEHAEATYSFTACSMNRKAPDGSLIRGDDEALNLADKAQGFFLFIGKQLLAERGVVVVSVENTQSRSAVGIAETDRRYGFDVRVRYEREDILTIPGMEAPITYMREE